MPEASSALFALHSPGTEHDEPQLPENLVTFFQYWQHPTLSNFRQTKFFHTAPASAGHFPRPRISSTSFASCRNFSPSTYEKHAGTRHKNTSVNCLFMTALMCPFCSSLSSLATTTRACRSVTEEILRRTTNAVPTSDGTYLLGLYEIKQSKSRCRFDSDANARARDVSSQAAARVYHPLLLNANSRTLKKKEGVCILGGPRIRQPVNNE